MLERQARRRRAPGWVTEVLRGRCGDVALREEGDSRLVVTGGDGARFTIEVRLAMPAQPAVLPQPWLHKVDTPDNELRSLADDELRSLSYIVVDEIIADTVALSVSPWPEIDELG